VSTNVAHPPLNDVFKTVIASLLLVLGTGTINAAEFPYRSVGAGNFWYKFRAISAPSHLKTVGTLMILIKSSNSKLHDKYTDPGFSIRNF
jgi:hypothetical protein